MAWFLGSLALGAGLVLVVIGWRGRRVNRHPLCARCGFDLLGGRRWETRECPECGADVSGLAVRVGERRRRAGALWIGSILSLSALLGLSAASYARVRGIDVAPRKPAWWLVHELGSAHAPTQSAAFNELVRRFRQQTLSRKHAGQLAEHCLAHQGRWATPWNPAWGNCLEAMRAAGMLTEAQWDLYATQAFDVTLKAQAAPARGHSLPVTLHVERSRVVTITTFAEDVQWSNLRIDGKPATAPPLLFQAAHYWGTTGSRHRSAVYAAHLDDRLVRRLSPGPHEITASVVLTISEPLMPNRPSATRTFDVSATCTIGPAPATQVSEPP